MRMDKIGDELQFVGLEMLVLQIKCVANIHINPHSAFFLIGIFFHNSILFAYFFCFVRSINFLLVNSENWWENSLSSSYNNQSIKNGQYK